METCIATVVLAVLAATAPPLDVIDQSEPATGELPTVVWVVDRIEGSTAVVEVGAHRWIEVPIARLPHSTHEGTTLRLEKIAPSALARLTIWTENKLARIVAAPERAIGRPYEL